MISTALEFFVLITVLQTFKSKKSLGYRYKASVRGFSIAFQLFNIYLSPPNTGKARSEIKIVRCILRTCRLDILLGSRLIVDIDNDLTVILGADGVC